MNLTPPSRYLFHNAKEAYRTGIGFNNSVEFLKSTAEKEGISIVSGVLVVEINESVYIRSTIDKLCDIFDGLAEHPNAKDFVKLNDEEWKKATQDIKSPTNIFGDITLIKFKIGF